MAILAEVSGLAVKSEAVLSACSNDRAWKRCCSVIHRGRSANEIARGVVLGQISRGQIESTPGEKNKKARSRSEREEGYKGRQEKPLFLPLSLCVSVCLSLRHPLHLHRASSNLAFITVCLRPILILRVLRIFSVRTEDMWAPITSRAWFLAI